MKILVCGDIHAKLHIIKKITKIVDNYDKIVFLGDYVDDWNASPELNLSALKALVELKKRNKHKIVLLLGNHDLSEWHGDVFKCSGYDLYASALLRPVFDKYKDYFQLAYATNNFLFTHAGVTNSWLKRHFLSSFKSLESATGISKMLNRQLSEWSKDFRDALSSAGFSRGGCGAPSPVWADKSELIRNPLPYINQVAGHTPVKTVTKHSFSNGDGTRNVLYFCDTHSTYRDGSNIGDNTFFVKKLKTVQSN